MPQFDIGAPIRAEAVRIGALGKSLPAVVKRATSTLARRLPVQARRDIQDEYNLQASRISDGLTVRQIPDGVALIGAKRGIGLIQYGGRWAGRRSQGATAQVYKAGNTELYAGTFIATGKNGNRQIFDRSRGNARLPLKTLYGPSVRNMLRQEGRADRLADFAKTILAAEIARLTGQN